MNDGGHCSRVRQDTLRKGQREPEPGRDGAIAVEENQTVSVEDVGVTEGIAVQIGMGRGLEGISPDAAVALWERDPANFDGTVGVVFEGAPEPVTDVITESLLGDVARGTRTRWDRRRLVSPPEVQLG